MKLSVTTYENKTRRVSGYLRSAQEVFDHTKEDVGTSSREMMVVLYLNTKRGIIFQEVHTIGTVDASDVYPRDIMKAALLNDASSIIMVHNHPSGDPFPSFADVDITKRMKECCKVLGVELCDHVILGDGRYYSFAEKGEL